MPRPKGDKGEQTAEARCKGGVGSTRYRGEDHALALPAYPPCWKCRLAVGCANCVGPVDDILCMGCAIWTTIPSFVRHGPIANTDEMIRKRRGLVAPDFDDYPIAFIDAYLARHGSAPKPLDHKATFKSLVGRSLPR